jgi:hypothetical protein
LDDDDDDDDHPGFMIAKMHSHSQHSLASVIEPLVVWCWQLLA